MNVKQLFILVVLTAALPLVFSYSAQSNYNNYSNAYAQRPAQAEDMGSLMRQIRTTLTDLKHEVNNHESEIRTFESQLNNQETILENLRQQLTESVNDHNQDNKARTVDMEAKLETLDNTVKGLITDMRQMKTQANESVTILGQYKQKMGELEKLIESQNQHMKNLENGLTSIVEVLQARDTTDKVSSKNFSDAKTYKVQSGDNLEKIARQKGVSVKALREANNLKQDRIVIGQTLKIPD